MEESPIHNRLHVLRAERGLSRQDLATALDVHYQTVGYLERGEYSPSLALAFRISGYFGLPIEAIFSPKPFRPMSVERGDQTAHSASLGSGAGGIEEGRRAG